MLSPTSIITAYPPDELADLIKRKNYKRIKVYGDLKNISTGLFVEEVVKEIVENTEINQMTDTNIFQSTLYFCAWWRYYGLKYNVPCDIYISTDVGASCYHKSINKKYKYRRAITPTPLSDYQEQLSQIRTINTEMLERTLCKIPNVHLFYLKFLESDFVPYYLITRKFKDESDTLHIICSSDKDMYQILSLENTVQIYKNRGTKYMIDKNTCLVNYTKNAKGSVNSQINTQSNIDSFDINYIPMLMALVGDVGDDVPGIKGVGPKTGLKYFGTKDVPIILGTMEEICDRVIEDKSVLKELTDLELHKLYPKWAQVYEQERKDEAVTNAFKQISFEMLCRWLERKNTTEKIGYLNYIDGVLNKNNTIANETLLYEGLSKAIPNFYIKRGQLKVFFVDKLPDKD